MDATTDKRDFLKALAELEKQHKGAKENLNSYRCEGCEGCRECMFCTGCHHCYKCTYCVQCSGCSECTHCAECEECHNSSYCLRSKKCAGSSYVMMSQDCANCTFCFGCVGLVGKDFHILNKPYPRKDYFAITAKLRKELGLPAR
jgi:hypothetical protein